jgi:hypothetical protein
VDAVPRLESVYFGGGQYGRLAAVLAHTARRYCPAWDVNVRRIEPHTLRAASGNASDADNHHKLTEWRRIVAEAPDGARILLVDADTFVTAPLDPLWDRAFDVAYTARASSPFPLNAGVVAIRVGPESRRFMAAWLARDAAFLADTELRRPWRKRYGGMNQASLGALLESGQSETLGVSIAALPCAEWNCEDTSWATFDPTVTRIVHVKSGLRMAVFNIVAGTPKTRLLARIWREIDAAVATAAVAS